jgi:hypothetical protein
VNASNENNVTSADIAYISCDPTSPTGGFINGSSVVITAGNAMPKAILLYSLFSDECTLTGTFKFPTMYTMTSVADSNNLYKSLQQNSSLAAVIGINNTAPDNSSSPTNDAGPAPTTAVAMSILYSITGIITLLFLIIIASGAIRAHRNPERYGPRAAVTGRARQSRAKGLARAMLETLPIVKFGDPEPAKTGDRDIELADGTSSVDHAVEVTGAAAEGEIQPKARETSEVAEINPEANAQTEAGEGRAEPAAETAELGCSICTEDFMTGEDVRVLPCNHKFHPACIDPWLLNVSGTCPLWYAPNSPVPSRPKTNSISRHNLQPVQSTTAEGADGAEGAAGVEGDDLPPPLSATDGAETGTGEGESSNEASHHHRLRVSRLLDLTHLRTAPPEERIAALRQLREQSQRDGEAEDAEHPSRPAGLTSRLRDKFRIKTRMQPATQE